MASNTFDKSKKMASTCSELFRAMANLFTVVHNYLSLTQSFVMKSDMLLITKYSMFLQNEKIYWNK